MIIKDYVVNTFYMIEKDNMNYFVYYFCELTKTLIIFTLLFVLILLYWCVTYIIILKK